MTLLHTLRAALVLACSATAISAAAQTYPQRPISLIVGYPAGGSVDLTARLFGEQLAETLGQSVVVENVGGAGGTIGAQRAVRGQPDGYTLLLGSTNEMIIASMINPAIKYDSAEDFTHLGIIASQPMLLAASPQTGVNNAKEYLEKVRAAPAGTFNYGSSGVGTTLHLAGEMINTVTSTQAEHIPYRGVGPLVTDLMSGQLNFGMLVLSSGLPQVRGGKVQAIGVTSAERSPIAPEIPALAETPGFEKVDLNIWFGLYAPKGLPQAEQDVLRRAVADVLKSDRFKAKIQESGGTLADVGVDPFAFQADQTARYRTLVEGAKLNAN